ncbi:MAG: radical SAM protein [Candidatus Omnitrophica bacterium]|nr:radical SAM protein [Candidatus Omnitrophota bacterium]
MANLKGLDYLRVLGTKNDKVFCGPERIIFDVNTECNINCIYCTDHCLSSKVHLPAARIKYKKFKEIIKQAKDLKVQKITLSGDGEPTLHPNIEEMIELVKKENFGLDIETNLTFKTSFLKSILKIDSLNVTLSASNQESYTGIQSPRDKDIFLRVMENLRILSKLKERYQKPQLFIGFIINKENYREIIPMLRLAENFKIDKIYFQMMDMDVTRETESLLLDKKDKRQLRSILSSVDFKKYSTNHNLKKLLENLINTDKSSYSLKACYIGWFYLIIKYNNEVFFCCQNDKKSRMIGDIKKNSLKEIWQGRKAIHLRLKDKYEFNLNKEPWKNLCERCFWFDNNYLIDKIVIRNKRE